MWHVDIVFDPGWLSDNEGKVVSPSSITKTLAFDPSVVTELGLYGDEFIIRHMRVVLDTTDPETARRCAHTYCQQWVSRVAVASGFLSNFVTKPVTVARNAAETMLLVMPGGFDAPIRSVRMAVQEPKPVDYSLAARMLAAWKPDFTHQLFYLARFSDPDMPLEVRWLNGYRSIEWHFCRGNGDLGRNKAYQAFVDEHGVLLDELRRPRQHRTALIEEARSLAAHAVEYKVETRARLVGRPTS